MTDTLDNIKIEREPKAISIASGIEIGSAIRIFNTGDSKLFYAISADVPSKKGALPIQNTGCGSVIEIAAGNNEVWVWSNNTYTKNEINVSIA